MTVLHIDLETRSAVELKKTGVYRYAEDASTDVWCAAYAVDGGCVDMWIPPQYEKPGYGKSYAAEHIADLVARPDTVIVAHNASFERALWAGVLTPRYGWPMPKLEQWRCTMVQALAMALPGSLENAAGALGI